MDTAPSPERRTYYSLGSPTRLVIAALGLRGGTKTVTDGVETIYARGLLDDPRGPFATVADDGTTYTLTDAGWELFYAGTCWARDYYGPGLVRGVGVHW